jgi:Secretion system C-terminal sorting domain
MKKLIIFFLLYTNLMVGQQTIFNLQSNFGYKNLHLKNVLPTDSCYYLIGVITDTTNQQAYGGSLFLKLSLNADTLLTKKLVSPSRNYLALNTDLIMTPDGNLVTAGVILDSIVRVFFVKYTLAGDTLFTKEYTSPNSAIDNYISAVDLTKHSHGYYLTATFIPDGVKNKTIVWKLDESGNVIRQKTYGYGIFMAEVVGSTLVEPDDGLVIGVCRTNVSYVSNDYFCQNHIFQVDSSGNLIWDYFSPNAQLLYIPNSIVKTDDGGLVLACKKGVEHILSPNLSSLLWHSYIFKLNADHQFVWGTELRGSKRSIGKNLVKILQANDSGGYVAYGTVLEDKSDGIERQGTWIVKVSNQGDSLWARYYTIFDGFSSPPDPEDFKATPDGGYIVCGRTFGSSENFGWLMKLDSFGCLIPGCNSNDGPNITTEAETQIKLAIYPNPTSDFLNFELRMSTLPQRASFRIVDANGKVVKELKSDSPWNTIILPVRDWASGVYWLQYSEGGEVRAVEQFIVNSRT